MRIAHCGDVHIRLLKRHREYRQAFENFFEELRNQNVDRVVVAGDLLHSKTTMSPEAISMTARFLNGCAEIAPTDVIIGNHDCIVNQPGRMDAISPILATMNNTNITLLKNSGIYDIDQHFSYGVFAINDEKNYPLVIDNKDPNRTYIALFHGAVNKAKTDVDFVLRTDNTITMFKEYDMVMMSDIHKMQWMRENDKGTPDVVYSGSLIQQNFGEEIDKGFILWDIPAEKGNHKVEFMKVDNEYGFYTIKMDDVTVPTAEQMNLDDAPAKPYVRISVASDQYDQITLQDIASVVRRRLNPMSLSVETNIEAIASDIALKDLEIENVYQLPVQEKMLRAYFKTMGLKAAEIKDIINIHREFFRTSISDEINTSKGTYWNIDSIKFDNTFSYGSGNEVDFSTIPGLVGIFSPNASGKSALLDSILMGFFCASSRASRNNIVDVLNKSENEASIEIKFTVDNKPYVIRRTITRNSKDEKRANNNVNIFEIDSNGEESNVTGDSNTRGTERYIRGLLGEYDEHKLTTFGNQHDLMAFINMRQNDRKEMLSRFMGLDVIEHLHVAVNEEVKQLKTLVKQYKKHDYVSIQRTYAKKRKAIDAEILEVETECGEIKDQIGKYNDEIASVQSTIREVSNGEADPEKLASDIKDEEVRLTDHKAALSFSSVETQETIIARDAMRKKLVEFGSFDELKDQVEVLTAKETKLTTMKNEAALINKDIETHSSAADTLTAHGWFTTTEVCKKCTFLSSAFTSRDTLPGLKARSQELFSDIAATEAELAKGLDTREAYAKARILVKNIESEDWSIQVKMAAHQHAEQAVEHSQATLVLLNKAVNDYDVNKAVIELNKKARERIAEIKQEVSDLTKAVRIGEKSINTKKVELGQIIQKLNDLKSSIDTLNEVESSYRYHSYLQDALSKNGIQLQIIKKVIPRINLEVRKVLSCLQNFEIVIEDEDDDIYIFIEDGITKRRIELGSGMEKTIAAIAIRAALSNISLLPRCNLFVIDEGFGALDTENLNEMNLLLGYLKSVFKSVIIISHIDAMQDICDHIITVKKEQGYSHLKIS